MNLILTNIKIMQIQAMTILLGVSITGISNLLLQSQATFDLNEIVGYAGMAFLAWATYFFRKMKGQIEINIKAGTDDDDKDKSSERK